ncbi:MAG TPA: TIGR00266 family protein [Lentisphaeria bacterium]|nr:TIGR00266 family protein [Lentisphaeria bacterium]
MRDDTSEFEFEVSCKPDFAYLNVQVPEGVTLKVESSAMACMDTNMKMKTKMRGGLGRMFTGESLFINEFTAEGAPAEIGIAPGAPGDLAHVYLEGGDDEIYLQNSGYVASSVGVDLATKWQGLVKGFFGGEGLFLVKATGTGDLWFSTFGAMIEVDVEDEYVVDTAYIVAFTAGLDYKVSRVGGYKSLFLSGEGFVARFSGQGKLWIQTRQLPAFGAWVLPFRPVKDPG